MITSATDQTIREAIVLPLIAGANTTADKMTELMKAQQIEKDKSMRLIKELEETIARLRNVLKSETESTTAEYDAKVKDLNARVDALAAEIVALNTKITSLEEQRVGWQNHIQALAAREAYLHTDIGVIERANRKYVREQPPPPPPQPQPAYQPPFNGGCAPGDGRP